LVSYSSTITMMHGPIYIRFSISVVLSVHVPSCKSLRTAKAIFIKCDAREFFFKICHGELGYQKTIMDTLCEELRVFLTAISVWRRHYSEGKKNLVEKNETKSQLQNTKPSIFMQSVWLVSFYTYTNASAFIIYIYI